MSDKTLMDRVAEIGEKIDEFAAKNSPVIDEKVAAMGKKLDDFNVKNEPVIDGKVEQIGKKLDHVLKEAGEKIVAASQVVAEKVTEEMNKIDDSEKKVDLPPIPSQQVEEELDDNADVAD